MGGNAIKIDGKSICGRLAKEQYEIMKTFVMQILSKFVICEIVLELPGKENYGDIDVLYMSDPNINIKNLIKEQFNVTNIRHIVTNGNVISFAFDCSVILDIDIDMQYFQIDLIKTNSKEHMDMSRFYFSYGDLGAIIGRISNYYGLKFGDGGLWCELFENTVYPHITFDVRKTIGKITLSQNPKQICDFFGYDYNFWLNDIPNFKSKNDIKFIFSWIVSSKLFKKKIFMFLNSDHRARYDMRPFYKKFIEYIEIGEIGYALSLTGETGGCYENKQLEAISYFKKEEELKNFVKDCEKKKVRQDKFSGLQLITVFEKIHKIELKDKKVGEKIAEFKDYCLKKSLCNSWENFLDTFDKNEISDYLEDFARYNL
jgi:hypothetical protein